MEAGDLFVWSGWGADQTWLRQLGDSDGEQGNFVKVVLPNEDEGDEDVEVVNVAVSEGQILVLDETGQVWLAEREGPVGTGWKKVEGLLTDGKVVVDMYCGSSSAFVVVADSW